MSDSITGFQPAIASPPGSASSGVRQWLRKISLIAEDAQQGSIDLSNLRVRFTTTHMTNTMPATLQARIFNLSRETAKKLINMKTVPTGQPVGRGEGTGGDQAAAKITLQAGYEGNFGIIFRGDLIQSKAGRESPTDTFVDLFCGDGDWAHVWGKINRTLAAGYTPNDINGVFKDTLSQFGQTVGDLPSEVPQQAAPRGKVMYGMARDYQRDLGRTYKLTAFPRYGALEWLEQSAYRPGDIVEVNANTGMIGTPQQTQYGVSVQMLLNPSVGPGSLLRIANRDIARSQAVATISREGTFGNTQITKSLNTPEEDSDGAYKVLGVDHDGDTRGNEWYTRAECVSTNYGAKGIVVPVEYGTAWQS